MLNFIVQLVVWILCIYGLSSLINDYSKFHIYKKNEKNIKLVMTVKNVEDGIEEYIRELTFGRHFYNNLVIIDMDSDDETLKILRKLEKEKYNMRVLNKNDGVWYLKNMIK